jgi:tRNA (adenine57-N1/adenine58-N1)-methyltransferase
MDFSLPHKHEDSLATFSNIRHIDVPKEEKDYSNEEPSVGQILIEEANNAAATLFLGNWNNKNNNEENDGNNHIDSEEHRVLMDSSSYPERSTPLSETITEDSLVVIFESFDSLKFCYPQKGKIFSNRNGHFHHDDFIGKPFGCKLRSRNNQGYGFVYLLKPTPELWSRSLNHRTQIIHFLDASMIVYYLNLRPNMVVCESGTGSGALSHCLMRTIAPKGMLHTYEFNKLRAETARKEFANNGVSHLSNVYHRDVCGKHGPGGFDRPQASVDAIVLDLPEPWLAVPHAAYCIKRNSRIVSYSPCIEQAQKTIEALKKNGFHTIKTSEFRLRENYVDEVEYEMPPTQKRQRCEDTRVYPREDKEIADDTGAAAVDRNGNSNKQDEKKTVDGVTKSENTEAETNTASVGKSAEAKLGSAPNQVAGSKRRSKTKLVARPFVMMRGHTAFLTFATSGNALKPKP